jgi:hypothetical protein
VDAASETQGPARAEGPSAIASVVSVDALLALQGAPGDSEGRRVAVEQGTRLLDLLEAIRLDLLSGDLGPGPLKDLLTAVERDRPAFQDPALSEILDEIDLRARVELAKHRML